MTKRAPDFDVASLLAGMNLPQEIINLTLRVRLCSATLVVEHFVTDSRGNFVTNQDGVLTKWSRYKLVPREGTAPLDYGALLAMFGLPKHVRAFTVRCPANALTTVTCQYHPVNPDGSLMAAVRADPVVALAQSFRAEEIPW